MVNPTPQRASNSSMDEPVKCGHCGSENVRREAVECVFPYGEANEEVQLKVLASAISCTVCGASYFDAGIEEAREAAVYEYLQLLTPRQLSSLLKYHRMGVGEFARLTRIGEASFRRWENGKRQNAATDDYLYLLGWEENVERIRARRSFPASRPPALCDNSPSASAKPPKFQVLKISDEDRRKPRFVLVK